MPVTVEQLRGAKFNLMMHLNLGRDGHRFQYRCIEFPEFTLTKASLRKPSRVVQAFYVRDEQLPSLQAVADALNGLWPNRAHRTLAQADFDAAAKDEPMKVPLEKQIAAVAREIAIRRNVYAHRVAKKDMTQEEADAEIAAMEGVMATLVWVKRHRERLLALAPELAAPQAADASEAS